MFVVVILFYLESGDFLEHAGFYRSENGRVIGLVFTAKSCGYGGGYTVGKGLLSRVQTVAEHRVYRSAAAVAEGVFDIGKAHPVVHSGDDLELIIGLGDTIVDIRAGGTAVDAHKDCFKLGKFRFDAEQKFFNVIRYGRGRNAARNVVDTYHIDTEARTIRQNGLFIFEPVRRYRTADTDIRPSADTFQRSHIGGEVGIVIVVPPSEIRVTE